MADDPLARGARVTRLPYLLPWVRVLLLIRSITSTTWGAEAWPEVKPVLRRASGDAPADRARGLVELAAGAVTAFWWFVP